MSIQVLETQMDVVWNENPALNAINSLHAIELRVQIDTMLRTEPPFASEEVLDFWSKMIVLDVAFFEQYYEGTLPFSSATYNEWSDESTSNYGMVQPPAGLIGSPILYKAGIVRTYLRDDNTDPEVLMEGTFKDNWAHGLHRNVMKDEAEVQYWENGVLMAYFKFNTDFEETERVTQRDPNSEFDDYYLENLSAI